MINNTKFYRMASDQSLIMTTQYFNWWFLPYSKFNLYNYFLFICFY